MAELTQAYDADALDGVFQFTGTPRNMALQFGSAVVMLQTARDCLPGAIDYEAMAQGQYVMSKSTPNPSSPIEGLTMKLLALEKIARRAFRRVTDRDRRIWSMQRVPSGVWPRDVMTKAEVAMATGVSEARAWQIAGEVDAALERELARSEWRVA